MSAMRYLPALFALALSGAAASACNVDAYCFECETAGQGGSSGSASGGSSAGGSFSVCTPACDAGEKCCDGACVDTESDSENCGKCGKSCEGAAHGNGACQAGKCSFECGLGFADCNLLSEDGCEADVGTDPAHCGDCDTICLFANAVPKCESGTCGIAMCNAGFGDCNLMIADGCEADLGIDPDNCKSCGAVCPAPANGKADCLAGMCDFGGCLLGFGDCNDDLADGCEIDLKSDELSCGACGYACPPLPNATPLCSDAACVIGSCDAGYADCDASTFDGCESFLATDVNHCGACNAPCVALPHAYPKCEGSMCAIGGCESGFADCDGVVANGCEADLSKDADNCGACMNMCPPIANGSAACSGFACGIGMCDAGYADCFGGAADGCETNLTNDVAHCGMCGNVCPAVPFGAKACVASACTIGMCGQSHADCNMNVVDGCETDLTNDVAHCGMCGKACPDPANGTPVCSAGACGLGACDLGYADCNNLPADGCEFDTQSDANNCGGCGLKCHSGTCSNAKCACQKSVLVLKDDTDSGTQVLANALSAAGYTVTISPTPSYQYNGTNPALGAFGAVVLLAGGPGNSLSVTTDMPVAGQQAIKDHVNVAGGGLVLTEWAAFHVANNQWQTMKTLVLLQRTNSYSGQVAYTVDPAFASHPLWAGLPATFTIGTTSNLGTLLAGPGAARVATGQSGMINVQDMVVIRDTPIGRIAEVAHAGNYTANGWSNANMQKLMANAVGWVARCQ